jgi:predicted enzyme related to lactoylglutathione lyase
MPNRFEHTELNTSDVAAAKAFYKKIFDWKFQDMPAGTQTYTMLNEGGRGIGGIQQQPMPGAPSAWLPYVTVGDVKKTLERAREAGATVVLDYHEIGANGAIGILVDPTGATLGLWESAKKRDKRAEKKADKKAKKADASTKAKKAEAPEKVKKAKKADKKADAPKKAEKARAPAKAKKADKKVGATAKAKKADKKK